MDEHIINHSTELLQSITSEQAWHYMIFPKNCQRDVIEFYSCNGSNMDTKKEELEILFGKNIVLHKISEDILKHNLSKYYLKKDVSEKTSSRTISKRVALLNSNEFLYNLIDEANNLSCSDIHIEAYEDISRIRFRIDGRLFERYIIKKEEHPALINQIKILSNLDIAEKRLPQDGRILFKSSGKRYDIRVSIVPSIYGEKIVLRLLRKSASDININELGFSKDQLDNYLRGVKKPNGIILISGPTGSGKTTSLYATLNILNKKDINILTIEDPVEYTIEGINQVQLREDIGLTFAKALKTFLRQDPDIIMLGEIRDQETAQMAIRAALTGHLVLSTIHTNSAWGIITRLIDMGIPPFLLSSTLNTAVAQRLIRKLCPICKEEKKLMLDSFPESLKHASLPETHFIPKGCEKCFNSGYHGRVAVYEVINIDNDIKEFIQELKYNADDKLKKKEIKTLSDSSLDLFRKGITSFEEIGSILNSEF